MHRSPLVQLYIICFSFTPSVKKEVYEEIVRKLKEEVEYYEAIVKKFEKKYGCSLEELEKKIVKDGVPIDDHKIWEDSIEWRNAVEELEKLKKLLDDLILTG